MWSIFKKCIFCDQDLPEKPTGVGEHVIPASIYGFWSSHDVCSDCINYFGSGVDRIAVTNPQILNSMHLLDCEGLEKKFEQMTYIANDKESGEKVLMIRRKGEFKTKAKKSFRRFSGMLRK